MGRDRLQAGRSSGRMDPSGHYTKDGLTRGGGPKIATHGGGFARLIASGAQRPLPPKADVDVRRFLTPSLALHDRHATNDLAVLWLSTAVTC